MDGQLPRRGQRLNNPSRRTVHRVDADAEQGMVMMRSIR